ncbi:CCC motif membrane protein [Mesonia maritima]|uniref:PurR-regulated permease PerM n=1 Tax=Mesonia maritima TaxID=1793873 RepID=A0ABU1KAZ4_9FLAO|nr:CCC motif membrane protein [Mesonia maritima]MDR6302217.1 putative PurR-regulated permease PerM [Mesonia maritima]
MEKQKLPNATISLILGIVSFIACCFTWGIGGILLSGISLYLANKDKKKFTETPEIYDNYSQVKTARIIAIIGLILSILTALMIIGIFIYAGSMEEFQRMMEEYSQQYEQQQID